MTAFPLDAETRAELLADIRARRGPFRYDVVAALELVAHYGVNRVKRMAAGMLLREVAAREVSSSQSGAAFTLFILEPEVARLTAKGILAHFRQERGLAAA
jgi:hypothetical protein